MQREEALRRADAVRRQRAQLNGDFKAGRSAIDEVLTDPPAFVQTAKVADLLLAVPKYGPVKVNKLLARCRIARAKTIGGLSQRQREDLAAILAGRAQAHRSQRAGHARPPRSSQEPIAGPIIPALAFGWTPR